MTLGRCWLLLFGVLPADYDDLCFERIEPQGFVETSQLLSQRVWRHERQIVGAAGSPQCTVHDRVSFTPRLGVPGFLSRLLIGRLFAWRHYRLRRRFGHAMP
ncbi:hypothetical protein [Chitinimonas koreensis]|uniref:hypothetical protein n=1 Tax=Chitinimonas koreensis TaxID=356302 RepID=UPI001654001E|nr:hypothetical protein [Chitinimonas koreensis]QNM95788.1 hypothetical protein H9L41_18400 [Chitinimonas koreensis]